MLPRGSLPELAVRNRVTDAIVRYRKFFFFGIALLYVISFNGRWRLGLDSSVYRGLGHSLATGKGYTFGETASHQSYPGLPVVLAGIERFISDSVFTPIAPLLFMLSCSVLTLFVTYRLIKLHFPEWIAVAVTCGVGVNQKFLQLSNEILTDIPFLLGVVTALYGWSLLRLATDRRRIARALGLLVAGLLLAAMMRPTFWIVACAWVLVCVFGLITGPRKFYGLALLILLIVWTLFYALDPRTKGMNPFSGLYEKELFAKLQDPDSAPSPNDETRAPSLLTTIKIEAPKVVHDTFPEAFLGQNLPWRLPWLMSAALLAGTILLLVRQPLWALMILVTLAVTSILSTTPRYYVMVLPALLVAWVLVLCTVAVRLPTVWGEILLLAGLSLVTILNIAKITPFVLEQRAMPFYEKYRDGKFVTAVEMAKLIGEKVEPGKKTLGPSATLMTYLSGRLVVTDRDILPAKKSPMHWPEAVAKAHIDYVVFPSREYRDKDEAIARLMERGLIRAGNTLGTLASGKMYLADIHVRVPEGDWRKLPLLSSIAARKKAALARARAATTRTVKKKPTSAQIRRWKASTRPVKKKKVPTSGQIRHWRATTRAAARAAAAQKHDPALSTRPSVSPTTLPAGPRPSSP
jgi:hypothetical protein